MRVRTSRHVLRPHLRLTELKVEFDAKTCCKISRTRQPMRKQKPGLVTFRTKSDSCKTASGFDSNSYWLRSLSNRKVLVDQQRLARSENVKSTIDIRSGPSCHSPRSHPA